MSTNVILNSLLNCNQSNILKIHFGNIKNNEIFYRNINPNIISSIKVSLDKSYRKTHIKYVQYQFENKIMVINNKKCYSTELIKSDSKQLDNIDILFSNLNNIPFNNVNFPCKKKYHNISENEYDIFEINKNINLFIGNNHVFLEINKISNIIKFSNEILELISLIDSLSKPI
jgi:hypothetical protein